MTWNRAGQKFMPLSLPIGFISENKLGRKMTLEGEGDLATAVTGFVGLVIAPLSGNQGTVGSNAIHLSNFSHILLRSQAMFLQ